MKQIVAFLLAVLATFAVVAQTPTLNYQAVVRDGSNDFTCGTIIVPTNLSDPIVFPATCTNAANLCDLIAVFDS